MDATDLAIRNATYRSMVDVGQAPTAAEVAAATGQGSDRVIASWRRLHDGHALVLVDRNASEPSIRMLNPFSAVETPFVVDAGGRQWFANCGWDAFGIAVVLRSDASIRTTCPDCAEPLSIDVRDYRALDPKPVFHVLVPARDWWSDIGFT
jgi:hypothetical protein